MDAELCEIEKMHGSPNDKQAEENSSNEQSLSAEIKRAVEEESGVKAEPDYEEPADTTEKKKHCSKDDPPHCETSPNQDNNTWSDDDASSRSSQNLVSTLRECFRGTVRDRTERSRRSARKHGRCKEKHRSRSRSCSARSYETSDRRYRTDRGERKRRDSSRRRSRSRGPRDRYDDKRRRSRSRRDRYDDRRSRSRSRDDSTDRGRQRSVSPYRRGRRRSVSPYRRTRHRGESRSRRDSSDRGRRRSVSPYRRDRHRGERRRSRSRSQHRMEETHSSYRSYDRRDDRNSDDDTWDDQPEESPKMCTTDHEATSNVIHHKQEEKSCSSRTTIETLRSRIQSTLKNSAANSQRSSTVTSGQIMGQTMQSHSFEQYQSKMSATQNTVFNGNDICCGDSTQSMFNFDETIFNSIVSTVTSSAVNNSHANVNRNAAMQFMDSHTKNIQISQFPVVQSASNQTTSLDHIKDPRIRKIMQKMQEPPTIPSQHKLQQQHVDHQTVGTEKTMYVQWGDSRGPNQTKSTKAKITYGEYRKQQLRVNSSETIDKAKISKFIPTPEAKVSEFISTPQVNVLESIATPKAKASEAIPLPKEKFSELVPSPKVEVLTAETVVTRQKATKKQVVVHEKSANKKTRKSTTLHKKSKKIMKRKKTKLRKEATETRAALYEKSVANENCVLLHEQPSVTKLEQSVNATVNEENRSSSDQAFSALKDIVNPQHLLTLLDMMKQMTESNSLAEVKDALKISTTDDDDATAIGRNNQPNRGRLNSTTTGSAGNPNQTKPKKNELDRLHEDINNMFIRDGVLSANGRRRQNKKYSEVDESGNVENAPAPVATFNEQIQQPSPKPIRTSQASRRTRRKIIKQEASPSTTFNVNEISCNGVGPIVVLRRLSPAMRMPRVKNNNPEWHSLKAVLPCQICYAPPGISLVSHYVNYHPNEEVVNSRLSPEAATFLRSSTGVSQYETIRTGGSIVYKQFCYFCNTNAAHTKNDWISHMIRHTGYFDFQCSHCSRKFSTPAQYHVCAPNSAIEKIDQPIFQQTNVMGYVCELCNYVRFYEHEMRKHLDNEHEADEVKQFKQFTFCALPLKVKCGRPRKVANSM